MSQDTLSWCKNIVSSDPSLSAPAATKDLDEYFTACHGRLKASKLEALKRARKMPSRGKRVSCSEEVGVPSGGLFVADVLLNVTVYSRACESTLRPQLSVEFLASDKIQNVFNLFNCPSSSPELLQLSRRSFRCPEDLEDFRKIWKETDEDEGVTSVVFSVSSKIFAYNSTHINWEQTYNPAEHSWLDLDLRIGEPCPLVHDSFCQHILVVNQISCATQDDIKRFEAGPLVYQMSTKDKRKTCRVCEQYIASLYTIDDRLAAENPCSFCLPCFEALHFGPEKKLIYSDFRIFPHIM